MSLHRQRVHQPDAGKQRMVAGRQDAGEDDGVDDASCRLGAGHFENDGERRGARILGAEIRIRVWHVEANKKNRENAAKKESVR